MDDYSTKIKLSAEHLIRTEFPEKALELDTLVSVCLLSAYLFTRSFFFVFRAKHYHLVKYRKFGLKFNYQLLMISSHI